MSGDPIFWTAGSVALLHTVLGPDHYLPFVALSRARGWSMARTLWTTLACGLGHVSGSIAVGAAVAAGSWTLASATDWQGLRGDLAAWLLLGFGAAYGLWGLNQLARSREHSHAHAHADGTVHDHGHDHQQAHVHAHVEPSRRQWIGWSLFVVFILGPCEPLVPLMLVPASQRDTAALVSVVGIFFTVTVLTMLVMVFGLTRSADRLARGRQQRFERFGHVAAGSTIACCGVAMLLGM